MGNFLQHVVVDANGDPLEDAIGQIYALTDTGNVSPLVIYDENGTQFALDQLVANNDGVTPRFSAPGYIAVKWVSGTYEVGMIAWDILPAGGSLGQALIKASANDYDMEWSTPPNLPTGGNDGEVLIKSGTTDYAAFWGPVAVTQSEVEAAIEDIVALGTGPAIDSLDTRYRQVGMHTIEELPAGATLVVRKSGSSWPNRPTSRTDIIVFWVGADPNPTIVTPPSLLGAYSTDIRMVV